MHTQADLVEWCSRLVREVGTGLVVSRAVLQDFRETFGKCLKFKNGKRTKVKHVHDCILHLHLDLYVLAVHIKKRIKN